MSRIVSLNENVIKEISKYKGEGEPWSLAIERIINYLPRTKAEEINTVFKPFSVELSRILGGNVQPLLEVFRMVLINLSRIKDRKDSVDELVDVLRPYFDIADDTGLLDGVDLQTPAFLSV